MATGGCRDRGDGPPATLGANAEDFCDAADEHATVCGNTPRDHDACVADVTCFMTSIVRADARSALVACVRDRERGTSDDRCFTAAGLGLAPTAGSDAYSSACLAKRDTCGGGFIDDFCSLDLVTDGFLADANDCVALACEDIAPCLEAIGSCSP
jgi:hypothetical protein